MRFIQKVFANNCKFIAALFLLTYFTMAWRLIDEEKFLLAFYYAFTVFLFSFIIGAVIEKLPSNILRKTIKSFLVIINIIPFIMETFVMHTYKILINAGIICSILETTVDEATEYVKMYVTVPQLIVTALAVIGLFFLNRFKWPQRFCLNAKRRGYLEIGVLLFGVFSTVAIAFGFPDFFSNKFLPLQRVASAMEVAVKNKEAYESLSSQVRSDVKITKNNSNIKNIVFILGESTNRNHMHLYGYYLPNTPNLDRLKKNNEICVFTDVVSAHSTTIASLSKVFTFCHHESTQPWYHYNNLIDVMNAAGYKTYWLSNQESSGIWGNVAAVYAAHSTEHAYTRIRDSHEDYGVVDGALFPLIDKAIKTRGKKNFYVIHLMGGHGLYYNRYPYSFNKFTAKDIKLPLTEHQKDIVSQYDDALYYNDYVVSKIIDKFRGLDAIVIYMPDHGEAVYDEGDRMAGHFEGNPNRHMIEIPFIIWGSKKFKQQDPQLWSRIEKSVNRPYMTDDMIHTVMDIAGIETVEYDPTRSIINPHFNTKRPRIYNGKNYDTQIKTGLVKNDDI